MESTKLIVLIPTRNRAELAVNAINSVLSQASPDIRIIVSDNSTSESELTELEKFCAALANEYVQYVRPPEPLSMTKHYDWAVRQALRQEGATHVLLLTDRMIFLEGRFADLVKVWRGHTDKIFTYGHNRLVDHHEPVRLEQSAWTGQVIELNSSHLLYLSSQMAMHVSLPRMMNCIVPRYVFEALDRRYGNLFDSIAPDFNFCYRSLEMSESIRYYDSYPLLHYALGRSNGESQARGIATKDHLDFIANLGGKAFNFAAPVPAIMTVGNAIIHEYCFVRQEIPETPKLPPVDREKYLQYMAADVEALENPVLRDEMRKLLASEGWRGAPSRPPWHKRLQGKSVGALLRKAVVKLKARLWTTLIARPTHRGWKLLARYFGIYPPHDFIAFDFADRAEAIDFANRFPRPKRKDDRFLRFLLSGH